MNVLPEYPYTKHDRQKQEERDRRRQAIKEFKQGRAMLREAQQQERAALRREGLTGWARVNALRAMQSRHSHDLEELEAQFSYVQKSEGAWSHADWPTWLSEFGAQATERLLLFVGIIGVVGRRVLQNEVSRKASSSGGLFTTNTQRIRAGHITKCR
jgi:G3E family GTPase